MKKNILLLSFLSLTFFSGFSQLNLDFENQPFSAQSWSENGTNWAITSGWANIRDYNGTAYNGTYSIIAPDQLDFVLENSADFNLNSLWIMWDNTESDATSFTFTAYHATDTQIGTPLVLSSGTITNEQYHNTRLNSIRILKL